MLKWNAYYYSQNTKTVKPFNVFEHSGFNTKVKQALRKCKTKDELAEQVRTSLFYHFHSKYEWEIIVSPFTSTIDKPEVKVDIYSQIMINWEHFIDYLWSQKYTN